MALDQINPIAPIAPVKFDDPIEKYGNFLKAQYLQSEIAKAKREEDDSTGFSNALKTPGAINTDGSINSAVASKAIADAGQGKQLPGFLKSQSEISKSNADAGAATSKAAKDDADTLHQKMQNYAEQFSSMSRTDPHLGQQEYYKKLVAMSKDPQIVKLSGASSPEEFVKSGIQESWQAGQSPQAWQTFADKQVFGAQKAADLLKENKVLQVKRGDKTDVIGVNPTDANPSINQLGEYSVLPAKGQTINVNNMPGPAAETAFAKAQGTSQSNELTALSGIATSAPQNIAKIDQALDIIKGGNFITGIGADKKLAYYKFLKSGGLTTDEQNKMIDNTEQLNKYLAGNTLDQTAAFNKAGLGARTSVQELKMLSDATARAGMEPDAMATVLLKQRQDLQDSIPRFNQRRGEFNQSGVSPALKALASHDIPLAADSKYDKETNPATGQPYDDPTPANIARLKAHPEEAPIFASHYGNRNLLKYGGH